MNRFNSFKDPSRIGESVVTGMGEGHVSIVIIRWWNERLFGTGREGSFAKEMEVGDKGLT